MTRNNKTIFLLAAEPSGDQLGAQLTRALKEKSQDIHTVGIGGPAMAEQGVSSDFDISPLAILGFTEAIRAYPVVLKKVKQAADMILSAGPDAVVLIDSWGFMVRVAKRLKQSGYSGKIIKYVAPQVWAMREGRARILAQFVDHLLSIQSFDAPYFTQHGLPVTFVGNPMFDDEFGPGNSAQFRKKYEVERATILAVLFGSRPTEIERLYEPFAQTIAQLREGYPELKMFAPVSDGVEKLLRERAKNDPRMEDVTLLSESEKYELFQASDLALACSGTVTTQLAMSGVPAVVAYKLSPVTFFIAKRLFKPDYISLVNISADKPLMPEFVQGDVNAAMLSASLKKFLDDNAERKKTSGALIKQAAVMKGEGGPASDRAASAILEILG